MIRQSPRALRLSSSRMPIEYLEVLVGNARPTKILQNIRSGPRADCLTFRPIAKQSNYRRGQCFVITRGNKNTIPPVLNRVANTFEVRSHDTPSGQAGLEGDNTKSLNVARHAFVGHDEQIAGLVSRVQHSIVNLPNEDNIRTQARIAYGEPYLI